MNMYAMLKAFLMLSLLSLALNVTAGLVTCNAITLAKVDYASACQRSLLETQDFLNPAPMTVNSEAFFGNTDWVFLKKNDPAGNGQTGTWALTNNEWGNYANIMLIFKDGNDTTLLGFLLTPTYTSGDWDSPFTAYEFPNLCQHHAAHGNKPAYDDCSKIKDVSHISYYGRGTVMRVSEPASVLLIALGLFGLVSIRSQKLQVLCRQSHY
jgi:hypothetical protein